MLTYAVQRAGEAVGVADVAHDAGALEPGGVDLTSPVEQPQGVGSLNGSVQDKFDAAGHHGSHVVRFAVGQLERFDDVEVVLLESCHEGLDLERLEAPGQSCANVRQQAVENLLRAVSSSAV